MELPKEFRSLYKHWSLHTFGRAGKTIEGEIKIPAELEWFIKERISIWKQKVSGKLAPYTKDPILAKYRFCNIFREFDRQTIEFHTLLNPLRGDFPLWLLNMFYCRMVARPETIKQVGFLSFDKKQNERLYQKLLALPRPRYGTPYVFPISAIQNSSTPTRELFITSFLPKRLSVVAKQMKDWKRKPVYDGVKGILPIFGFNLSFLWTEALIDTAYQFPEKIDLFEKFPIGPGAFPTLRKLDPKRDPSLLVQELCFLELDSGIEIDNRKLLFSAENWEGIACEYRKYTNLKNGKGRKRIFRS